MQFRVFCLRGISYKPLYYLERKAVFSMSVPMILLAYAPLLSGS